MATATAMATGTGKGNTRQSTNPRDEEGCGTYLAAGRWTSRMVERCMAGGWKEIYAHSIDIDVNFAVAVAVAFAKAYPSALQATPNETEC